jgi:hypothetical protein
MGVPQSIGSLVITQVVPPPPLGGRGGSLPLIRFRRRVRKRSFSPLSLGKNHPTQITAYDSRCANLIVSSVHACLIALPRSGLKHPLGRPQHASRSSVCLFDELPFRGEPALFAGLM